jgi:hypothetical protein
MQYKVWCVNWQFKFFTINALEGSIRDITGSLWARRAGGTLAVRRLLAEVAEW